MKLQELQNIITPISIHSRRGNYNVYAIVDEHDTVIYIGKGTEKRLRNSNRNDEHMNLLMAEKKARLVPVVENILRPTSEALEMYLITKLREFEYPLYNQWTITPSYVVNTITGNTTINLTKAIAAHKCNTDPKTIVSPIQAIGEDFIYAKFRSPECLLPLIKAGRYSAHVKQLPVEITVHVAKHENGTIIKRATRSALAKPCGITKAQVHNAYHKGKTTNGWTITIRTAGFPL